MRLLAEPVKSARKIRQEARQKAQAEKLEKKLGLTAVTPGKVKSETPNKGGTSETLCLNEHYVEFKMFFDYHCYHCFRNMCIFCIQNRASELRQLAQTTTQTCQCRKVPSRQESTQHLQPEHQQLPHSGCRGHPTERGHLPQPPWPV